MNRLELAVLSSTQLAPVAEAIAHSLQGDDIIASRVEGRAGGGDRPLDASLKVLLAFDGAVLVLGVADLRPSRDDGAERAWVPGDDAIFALGVCLGRFGTSKTVVVCPERPAIQWPGSLDTIVPLTYEDRGDGGLLAAVAGAGAAIRRQLERLGDLAYLADLPAVGLAYGYVSNFLNPLYRRLAGGERPVAFHGEWRPEQGFSISVVLPDRLMQRDQVHNALRRFGLETLDVDLPDGRTISVHARPRVAAGPLELFDIPTTLSTSADVIRRLEAVWGGDDRQFRDALQRREIASFERSVQERLRENGLSDRIQTISIADVAAGPGSGS